MTSQSEHETDLLARWREQRDEVDVLKAQLLGADDLQVDDYDDPEPEPGPDPEPEHEQEPELEKESRKPTHIHLPLS